MMWTLIIALVIGAGPKQLTFIPLASLNTYEECRDLSKVLKKYGLNEEVHFYCVAQP